MNEQAQKILVDLLQKASNGIDSAVSFSQAQIPDVVHQLLLWNFTSSLLSQALGLLMVFSTVAMARHIIVRYGTGKIKDGSWVVDQDLEYSKSISILAFLVLCGCVAFFIIGFIFIVGNFDWLKIWLAPKLYLIEYAASLVK